MYKELKGGWREQREEETRGIKERGYQTSGRTEARTERCGEPTQAMRRASLPEVAETETRNKGRDGGREGGGMK